MEIEYDPEKDAANQVKHGLSLADTARMELAQATVTEDRRVDYGEARFIAYAPLDGRLHVLWFTMRGPVLRAIGLRKANERERKRYDP